MSHNRRHQVLTKVTCQISYRFIRKLTESALLLQSAAARIRFMSMFLLCAAEVDSARVLWALSISVFTPAFFINSFIYLASVSVDTGLCGLR